MRLLSHAALDGQHSAAFQAIEVLLNLASSLQKGIYTIAQLFLRMLMKRHIVRLLSLVLVVCIGLMGCSASPDGLSGNYREDTLKLVSTIRTAIELPDNSSEKGAIQSQARQLINDFSARYQRNGTVLKLPSFTTMRTALNSLAGHYSSYPNRPVPQKLKDRLEQELKQVEATVNRGS